MTLKNNRAPLLCYFKHCSLFRSHPLIQSGVTARKRPIWVKISHFLSRVTLKFDGWPWKIIGHLCYATSSFVHHFVAIGQFKLFLVSSACGCEDCCHPVGLEGSLLLTRRLTMYLMTSWFNTGGGMSSAMNWHTGFGAWITVPASCISAPTIIGQMIVHPMAVFSIIQGFFLQHFVKAASSRSLEKSFLCSLLKSSLIR